MKKILYAVMILLGLSMIISCEKSGNGDGDGSLVGNWVSAGGAGTVYQSVSSINITSSTITMVYRDGSVLFQEYGKSKTVSYTKGDPYEKEGTIFQRLILDEPLFGTEKELFYTVGHNPLTGTALVLYTLSFDNNLFFSK